MLRSFTIGLILCVLACCAASAAAAEFTVAALTLTPEPWNKTGNFEKLAVYARQAAAQGAQVIVAPEGYLEGYVGNRGRTSGLQWTKYLNEATEEIDGPLMKRVRALARELKVYLMLGFAERLNGKIYNTAVMFSPAGDLVSRYAKTHTADDEPFNTKGVEFPVVQTALGRWGTLICFDRRLPEAARILAIGGAQLIFVPSWGTYNEINDQMMRVRAYENGVHVVFAHPKRGLIIDPGGNILAQNQGERDQVVAARVQLRPEPPQHLRNRRPEIYGGLLEPNHRKK
jgi:predicted amidohydrolase